LLHVTAIGAITTAATWSARNARGAPDLLSSMPGTLSRENSSRMYSGNMTNAGR
jgi:hypothetical protein